MTTTDVAKRSPLPVVLLFLLSGFAGLVYEVVWLRWLGLLFGNTAHATATTLAAFFLGLAIGGRFWGDRARRSARPLALYGALELGVTAAALLPLGLADLYRAIHASLFQSLGPGHPLFLAIRLALSIALLAPAASFMGGTLPVLARALESRRTGLARSGPVLYAANTIGAAAGAWAAGFHLPPWLGYRGTYAVAMGATLLVAAVAFALARRDEALPAAGALPCLELIVRPDLPIARLAFLSGFLALALEVLWTRLFAQVLQNSVYTFAAILVAFLVALGLGGVLAWALERRGLEPRRALVALLVASAVLVAGSVFTFHLRTHGLTTLGGRREFAGYVLTVFGAAALVVLPPGIALGAVFPTLFRAAGPGRDAGAAAGRLVAANTLGSIAGALAAGFLLLDALGLGGSFRLVAVAYALAGLLLATRRLLPAIAVLAVVTVLDPARLPAVHVDPAEGEFLLDLREGSAATVAVVRDDDNWKIKVNNRYTLGDTASAAYEERQADLPLQIHPRPRRVFVLGLGTGITAGAVLDHPVERVVACEIVPDVIEVSRRWFGPWVGDLFDDPRVRIFAEDGRAYLTGTSETFDVILADLFVPWRAGVGSVYSVEHYRAARDRLAPGGLVVQWLPLYQLSREGFERIARTLLAVFDLVTLWRGDFELRRPVVALVGHLDASPLDPQADERGLPLALYCGNLTAAADLLGRGAIQTDDRPLLDFRAPVDHRRGVATAGEAWFTGPELVAFLDALAARVPPEADPYLRAGPPSWPDQVRAGLEMQRRARR